MNSIFDKIVRKEDDFTQLLCNLMGSSPAFHDCIASLFTMDGLHRSVEHFEASAQVNLRESQDDTHRGRPDAVIKSASTIIYLEVKIERDCKMTVYQKDFYADGLSKIARRNRFLVFLTPDFWTDSSLIQEIEHGPEVSVRHITWSEVMEALGQLGKTDIFVAEFYQLLQNKFGKITWNEEERKLALSDDFGTNIGAYRKLMRVVDDLKKCVDELPKLRPAGFRTQWDPLLEEYGFYLIKKRQYIAWIGMWSVGPTPISFTVSTSWVSEHPKAASDLAATLSEGHNEWTATPGMTPNAWENTRDAWLDLKPRIETILASDGD
jgi:hypothetical protein